MDTQRKTVMSSFVYNRIPTKVSRKDFHRYIDPHLQRPNTGPKPNRSLYKIFNYILSLTVRLFWKLVWRFGSLVSREIRMLKFDGASLGRLIP